MVNNEIYSAFSLKNIDWHEVLKLTTNDLNIGLNSEFS